MHQRNTNLVMKVTRAARYANHSGGRKYAKELDKNGKKVQLERGNETDKMKEKRECSNIFRAVWLECKDDDKYQTLRDEFLEEQKNWDASSNASNSDKVVSQDDQHKRKTSISEDDSNKRRKSQRRNTK